ncbi:MAG: hypothetical protein AB7S38_25105 [Vulcanimicrobiota bacterium]
MLGLQRPVLVGRLGGLEGATLAYYLRHRPRRPYPEWLRERMHYSAGLFSNDDQSMDVYSMLTAAALRQADLLAVWWAPGEASALRGCLADGVPLVNLANLQPFRHPEPWSQLLAGKKVVVVHPFEASIRQNYARRHLLFDDPAVLPGFELEVVKAVQGVTGIETGFADWFAAFEWMKAQLSGLDYEVALVGCGAYGLPLAAWIKGQGRQAIHLGGVTQLLFGIRGRRWDRRLPAGLCLQNWTRPLPEETPPDFMGMEDGCYW